MEYTKEQQAENRRTWVEALRSGKYKQASGQLRIGDAFCCLGVACDISGLGSWNEYSEYSTHIDGGQGYKLPASLMDYLGLRTPTGDFEMTNLSSMNDNGKSFEEIADVIEREPERLLREPYVGY